MLQRILAFGVAAGWATAGVAQCRVAAAGPCGVELHGEGAPRSTGSCADEAWKKHIAFELPQRFADDDENGWHEVVLQLDLDPALGCGCAVFRVAFEGEPAGLSVNIGDSPTNDGHGGDADTTRFDAELMVQGDGLLSIFGSDRHGAPVGSEQILGLASLPFADRVVELEVCDQSIRFAIEAADGEKGISGLLNEASSGDLLAIRRPDVAAGASGEAGADARIFAAFNRVIHRRTGRPAQNRFGTGVRRVEISLTP